ncbi:MAG: UDP-N-acetylmuramoyl-L-alanyl-D-glutamate--2,6-diaminopimelate ligase [Flexistipes sinusarabici]|uniref:UDP-N-acetylmuramoyl-L-alanyl-D-glutamate--2,6-diaminopimelate ligase n=1 Tax=Flexistipes sinusarabici TaxID=2352 RepID=A0A5D0MQJ5_FLESI|nr:UDP-N-acetylmuramoyl-L-alanyl-D-glutamate--2,6-diaminopimelate ligase [Flexistipes sinusarabici]TYB33983.1 MAG: UDP-N-acetylmuramoyl-L-alanyl-D-glutamate--2,6-diaminopimelate ligase [Flexistipes sinusarabici]
MKLKNLLKGVNVLSGETDVLNTEVEDIAFDSRFLKKNSVFVAYKGTASDSHEYIGDIAKTGQIRAFVTERPVENVPHVVVDSGRRALAMMSRNYFSIKDDSILKIAVTGTNGKTTINYLLDSIFSTNGMKVVRVGTTEYKVVDKIYQAKTTTPSSYEYYRMMSEGIEKGAKAICIEASSHALEQERLYGTCFDLSIFTNLTGDHLDYHESMEKYFKAKQKLFSSEYSCKSLINVDDFYGGKLLGMSGIPSYSYAVENSADFKALNIQNSLDGVSFVAVSGKDLKLQSNMVGNHNIYNILAAAAASNILGVPDTVIYEGIKNLKNIPGRLEKIVINNRYFFVDYAHTDDALKNVLQSLSGLKKKRLITVFGCGGDRDNTKRPRMAKAAEAYSDKIIVTSDNPRTEDPAAIIRDIEAGFAGSTSYDVIPDRREAIIHAYEISEEEDIILVAGKGHEDYQILKDRTIHFDDRQEIKKLLEEESAGL